MLDEAADEAEALSEAGDDEAAEEVLEQGIVDAVEIETVGEAVADEVLIEAVEEAAEIEEAADDVIEELVVEAVVAEAVEEEAEVEIAEAEYLEMEAAQGDGELPIDMEPAVRKLPSRPSPSRSSPSPPSSRNPSLSRRPTTRSKAPATGTSCTPMPGTRTRSRRTSNRASTRCRWRSKIFDVHIPMEDVMEIKGGKKQVVQKKVFPGYLLVKMVYDNDSWYVVRNTPGVTGFVSSRHRHQAHAAVAVARSRRSSR